MFGKSRAIGLAVLMLGGAFLGLASPVAATPPPDCCFTKAIEPYASYVAQSTCDPTVKPGTDKLRDLLLAQYPGSRDLGIVRNCSIGGTSEHKEGRAFDWGVRVDRPAEKAMADEFTAWLLKNDADGADAMARRMGIMYMIWNGRIWGSYAAADGWRTYTGSNPHTDHVHFSLSWDGAMGRTSYWCCRTSPGDTAKPETTPTLTGTAGLNGWYTSAVSVKLTATDTGGSGVDHITYRVDLGAWKTYTAPFSLAADGSRRVDYYAVDNAGNQEAAETITVKIDEVAPNTNHALAGTAGNEGWFRSAVTVNLAATDATSGVATTSATRDGASVSEPFTVSGDGTHTVTYRSRDVAGNWEATTTLGVKVDATPPSTAMARSGPAHQGAHLYVSEATTFTLAASDATSGVKATTRTWQGATAAYTGAFRLGGPDGSSTLAWRSEDRAGNVEGSRSQALFLDTTAPTLAIDAPAGDSVVVSLDPVAITADAADAGSGVARVEFLVDGAVRATDPAAPYAWAWAAGDEALGEHTLEVRAVDHLGHATSIERTVTTVPTSVAGVQATVAAAPGAVPGPPGQLPVVGVIAEPEPGGQVGVLIDDAFVGVAIPG